jgi:hypothetical protein
MEYRESSTDSIGRLIMPGRESNVLMANSAQLREATNNDALNFLSLSAK